MAANPISLSDVSAFLDGLDDDSGGGATATGAAVPLRTAALPPPLAADATAKADAEAEGELCQPIDDEAGDAAGAGAMTTTAGGAAKNKLHACPWEHCGKTFSSRRLACRLQQ